MPTNSCATRTSRCWSSRRGRSPPRRPDKSGPLEQAIATQAARFIPDGATLEFGIGALPEAVCRELATHSRLSVHSGTVGDAVVDLLQAGAVAGVDCAL